MRYLLFAVLGIFTIGFFAVPGAFAENTIVPFGQTNWNSWDMNFPNVKLCSEPAITDQLCYHHVLDDDYLTRTQNSNPNAGGVFVILQDMTLNITNSTGSSNFTYIEPRVSNNGEDIGSTSCSPSSHFSTGMGTTPLPVGTTIITCNADDYDLSASYTIIVVNTATTETTAEPELTPPPNTVYNAVGSATPGCEETDECFIPSTITIGVGETITWENTDNAAHTATSGEPGNPDGVWDSSLMMVNGSYSVTLDEAGTYPYHCGVHPWMQGTVVVEGSSTPESEPPAEPADTVPPQVLVPDDIVIETYTQGGASATFNPQAIDNIDELISISCNYSSGSVFPIGTTEVTCTATDSAGNTNSNSFNVIIELVDTTPPTVSGLSDITTTTSDNNGKTVTFHVTASDNIGIISGPTCTPSSGSLFSIGTTTVTCTATDASGNTGSNSFNVIIEFSAFVIPDWIKNVAGFWHAGDINDASFLEAIAYLIENDIIIVPTTESGSGGGAVPAWVKNNAGWWATGQIDDETFVNALQYLIQEGILQV